MIKRLASAPSKKTPAPLRPKNKKMRRVVSRAASHRAGKEEESTLAAEQVLLIYDAAEAKHAKA
jgi:hypothetical protein